MTAVQFVIVDAPISERLGVHLHVVFTSGVTSTRLGAEVFINPELHAFGVNLAGEDKVMGI